MSMATAIDGWVIAKREGKADLGFDLADKGAGGSGGAGGRAPPSPPDEGATTCGGVPSAFGVVFPEPVSLRLSGPPAR